MGPLKLVSFLLLATAYCAASTSENTTTAPGCPVNIYRTNVRHQGTDHQSLEVRYINSTDKVIIGAKFSVDLMDATGDFTEYLTDFTHSARMKPKDRELPEWDLTFTLNPSTPGFRVTVKKIAFNDGTTWQDDGTSQCRVVEDYRRK
jgi:hypothetical protein